jgi:general nucleoside transport system permease protein
MESILTAAFIINLLASTIRGAAPILLTALGEIFTEKSGVLNIGLEAQMLTGALAGFIGAYYLGNNWLGLLVGMVGGVLISLLFALLTISLNASQIVVGITMNIFALGLTTFVYRQFFGTDFIPPAVEPMQKINIPGLSTLPFFGPIFFDQKALVYIVFLLVPIANFVLYRTMIGLSIRSVGEHPLAAETMGKNVRLTRYLCIMLSGVGAGLGGAFLSIGQLARFSDNMAAGRGFIALAIVIFGQWRPYRAALAALIFGFAYALSIQMESIGISFPEEFLRMIPYVVTVIAMMVVAKRAIAPAALAAPYTKEE